MHALLHLVDHAIVGRVAGRVDAARGHLAVRRECFPQFKVAAGLAEHAELVVCDLVVLGALHLRKVEDGED